MSNTEKRWTLEADHSELSDVRIFDSEGNEVAICYNVEDGRLIAQSPELLRQRDELLEALEELVDFASIDHKHAERSAMAFTTARLAIADATTNQPKEQA